MLKIRPSETRLLLVMMSVEKEAPYYFDKVEAEKNVLFISLCLAVYEKKQHLAKATQIQTSQILSRHRWLLF